MTKDKLHRGNEIQNDLALLNIQLSRFEKPTYTICSDLRHACSNEIEEQFEQIETKSKQYIKKLLKDRISILEKEFNKL